MQQPTQNLIDFGKIVREEIRPVHEELTVFLDQFLAGRKEIIKKLDKIIVKMRLVNNRYR